MPKTKKVPNKITPKLVLAIVVFAIGMIALVGTVLAVRGTTFISTKAANDCATCKKACKDAFPPDGRGREHAKDNYDKCIKTCKKGVCKYDPENIVVPPTSGGPEGLKNTPAPSGKPKSKSNPKDYQPKPMPGFGDNSNTLQPTPWVTNNGSAPSGD